MLSVLFSAMYAVIYLGLLFFRAWARIALSVLTVSVGLSLPLFGLSVQSGYEGMIGYFMVLGDGFVVALSFFSALSLKFKKEQVQ